MRVLVCDDHSLFREGLRLLLEKLDASMEVTLTGSANEALEATRSGMFDLIVRGACMLPPGIPGVTDRIRVRSVIGRFLEHSRISYFTWGDAPDDEALFLSSADWMGRNMFGRIEVAWPVRDAALRQRVIDECLVPYLHDRRDAWELHADGSYARLDTDGLSAQQALVALHTAAGLA